MANEGHVYFIGIFEQVYDLLSPRCTEEKPSPFGESDKADDVDFINSFEGLDVHDFSDSEISAWAEGTTPVSQKTWTQKSKGKKTYKIEDREEELFFSLYCFYSDMNDVRQYLRDLWSQYKNGKLDLIVSLDN